ncbi:MAG: hypothetical protein HC789_09755 [Microcoleus sp. CSU_2_2]|nr:hypothetical protein [Microcoleus sp. SU_5_3]NJS10638.1 hypothetical protein [Microcoleus sp. CSU_2_2]
MNRVPILRFINGLIRVLELSTVHCPLLTAGIRTTAGYIPLKDYLPQQDATAVARLRYF